GETRFAIKIPYALSLLAFHDPQAEVKGLDAVPRELWPKVSAVHFSFDLMVGLGSYLALVALWAGWLAWRRGDLAHNRWLMRAIALATPMGFIAIEAGWMVTELGRQPWVIYGVMKTRDAVTPMPGLIVPFLTFTLLYCFLGVIVGWLLYRQILRSPDGPGWEATHVWLILAIVLLFTCFPPAFALLGTRLHIPLSLVLIGIVLRGSAFTFWRYGGGAHGDREQRRWGLLFAVASLITPLL